MALTSNSVQNHQNQSRNMSTTPAQRTFRTGSSTITVREGETLKGVVSDIHGSEITISMENGSSFTGKLPEASQYSIGQKAAFLITSMDNGTIYMKAMSHAYLLGMEDTIEQALEEAGLPKSPRNLEVVRSLLQNQQSISRENIANFLQLCSKYPEADVNNVITMYRLGFSMDPETVAQFDSYQKQTHQLLYRMENMTESIGKLLAGLSEENPAVGRYAANEILNIALDSTLSLEEFNIAAAKAETTALQAGETPSTETAEPVNAAALTPEAEAPAEGEAALAGTKSSPEAETSQAANNSPLARMRELFSQNLNSLVSHHDETEAVQIEKSPFIPEQSGHLLSGPAREELADILSRFTDHEDLLSSLKDGTLTARELLTQIRDILPSLPDEALKDLFDTRSFQKMLKGQFLSNWTISPEGLREEGSMERLYEKMNQQFEHLTNLSRMFATRPAGEQVINNTTNMQQNLQFMQTLNEQFAYMQLPMKLSEENAHGDLYVMTRKNALKKSKDNLKVLLHLEMDSLGTLDIHITKENTSVATKFYVAKNSARKLLEKNADMLKDALNNQGFAFTSEFIEKEKDIDIVQDFIQQDAPVGTMTRYNFDLRA